MLVNASKTELLLCGDRRQLCQITKSPTITFMEQIRVKYVCSNRVRNLDVIIDSTLSWDVHVNHVIGLCFGILIGLYSTSNMYYRNVCFLAASTRLCSLTFVTVLRSMAVQTVPPLRNFRRSSTFPQKLSQDAVGRTMCQMCWEIWAG